ncbi:MAG: EamA family transporter [Flavobacteriales bacterium]|nr:MAG: EamA family transporter [Flavobacteriales bacterium]
MPKHLKTHAALLLANLIYGLNYLVAKDVMPDYVQPFGFIFLRVVGASVIFWLIGSFFISEKVEKKDFFRLALCGLFGVATNQLLFFKGLNITTEINASIIMTTNPILVLIAASFLLKEKITGNKIAGILIGLIGAVTLLTVKDDFQFGSDTVWGDFLVLLNATSYGIYLVIAKPLVNKYHPLTVVKWVYAFGLVFVLPVGFGEASQINWESFTPIIWVDVLYVVIFTTIIAYFLNIFALKKLSPSVVSTYLYLQPVFAASLAVSFGRDELTWIKIISAILICLGVFLVSRPLKKSI